MAAQVGPLSPTVADGPVQYLSTVDWTVVVSPDEQVVELISLDWTLGVCLEPCFGKSWHSLSFGNTWKAPHTHSSRDLPGLAGDHLRCRTCHSLQLQVLCSHLNVKPNELCVLVSSRATVHSKWVSMWLWNSRFLPYVLLMQSELPVFHYVPVLAAVRTSFQ